ncbi:MAG TPA: AraC family transcriptional regulator [Niastella sp.]
MQTLKNNCDIKDIITKACTLKSAAAIQLGSGQAMTGSFLPEQNILIFVLEGQFEFCYGETSYMAEKHQIAFLRKDVLIQYKTAATEQQISAVSFLLFVLNMQLVLEFAKLAHLEMMHFSSFERVVVDNSNNNTLAYMTALQAYLHDGRFITENLVRIKLLELLFCISGNNRRMLEQILQIRESYHMDITHIVEENLTNGMSLKQLAILSGRSLSSFRRDFLFIYNMPPSRWIRHKRLDKAKELLLSTNMPVTSICYTLGFESIAHFSRIFKSRFGCAPSDLRVNHLQIACVH